MTALATPAFDATTTEPTVAADPSIPRLRDDLSISTYGRDAAGNETFVVTTAGHAFLLSATAVAVVEALRDEPTSIDELLHILADEQPVQRAAVEEFLASGLPDGLRADRPVPPVRDPFLARMKLIPPSVTIAAGRMAAPLFHPRVAAIVLPIAIILTLSGLPAAFHTVSRSAPHSVVGVLSLILLAMFAHELGHVSACEHCGVHPGEVGIAIYFWFPVLYADVSRSWQLQRQQRLAVTSGGFYFQICGMAAAALWARVSGSAVANWFVFANALSIVHMLNPMFKMDGYWLLSDITSIPNLHRRIGGAMREVVRAFVATLIRGRDAGSAQLHQLGGWQVGVIGVYVVLALAYFGIIGQQLAGVSLSLLSHAGSYGSNAAFVATRITTAPTVLMFLSRVLELLFLIARPLLLLAGWVFLARQFMRLVGLSGNTSPQASTTARLVGI